MIAEFFESLRTNAAILKQIVRRQALAETLTSSNRGHAVAKIIRCGCGDPTSHLERVCPKGYYHGQVEGWNARINAGALQQSILMGSAAGTPFSFLALSTASLTIATGDTTLASEITSGTDTGLVRAAATYGTYTAPVSVGGSASYVMTHTYTAATGATVQSCAIFDAVSTGHMFSEINFGTSAVLAAGDSLAVTYTFTI